MIGISCLIKVRLIKMNFQIQDFSNLFEISRGDLKSHVGSFHSMFLIYLMINESSSPFYLHHDSWHMLTRNYDIVIHFIFWRRGDHSKVWREAGYQLVRACNNQILRFLNLNYEINTHINLYKV